MKFFIQPLYKLYRTILRHPKYRGWVIAGSLIYLLSPLDISPDVLPILGWIDDGVIATLLVSEISQLLLDRRKAKVGEETASVGSAQSSAKKTPIEVDAVAVGEAA